MATVAVIPCDTTTNPPRLRWRWDFVCYCIFGFTACFFLLDREHDGVSWMIITVRFSRTAKIPHKRNDFIFLKIIWNSCKKKNKIYTSRYAASHNEFRNETRCQDRLRIHPHARRCSGHERFERYRFSIFLFFIVFFDRASLFTDRIFGDKEKEQRGDKDRQRNRHKNQRNQQSIFSSFSSLFFPLFSLSFVLSSFFLFSLIIIFPPFLPPLIFLFFSLSNAFF